VPQADGGGSVAGSGVSDERSSTAGSPHKALSRGLSRTRSMRRNRSPEHMAQAPPPGMSVAEPVVLTARLNSRGKGDAPFQAAIDEAPEYSSAADASSRHLPTSISESTGSNTVAAALMRGSSRRLVPLPNAAEPTPDVAAAVRAFEEQTHAEYLRRTASSRREGQPGASGTGEGSN
jgi:hypothetical protein